MANSIDKSNVLWSSGACFALNKPRFIHSVRGRGHSVEDCLEHLTGIEGAGEATPVNRLDFETSGLLLCVTSSVELQKWRELYKKHLVEKTYLALVHGRLHKSQNISGYLGSRYRGSSKVSFSSSLKKRFLFAESLVQPMSYSEHHDLTLVSILTRYGRRHQVRVHCQTLGHPLLGDELYNGSSIMLSGQEQEGFFLHSFQLKTHGVQLEAPLFSDFSSTLDALNIPSPGGGA